MPLAPLSKFTLSSTYSTLVESIIVHPCYCLIRRLWRRQLRELHRRGRGRQSSGIARTFQRSNTAEESVMFCSGFTQEYPIFIYLHALQLSQEPALVVIARCRRGEAVDQRLAVGGHIRTALFEFRTVDSHLDSAGILKKNIQLEPLL